MIWEALQQEKADREEPRNIEEREKFLQTLRNRQGVPLSKQSHKWSVQEKAWMHKISNIYEILG